MITVEFPGGDKVQLEHAVFDFNGTLAVDGIISPTTAERLKKLMDKLEVHVITANTYGSAVEALAGMGVHLVLLEQGPGGPQKRDFVDRLGPEKVIALGNGRNDAEMLKAAALGIVIIGREGAASEAIMAADIACYSIEDALDCLLNPQRLVATLRS
ncbi:MAG TPA: ATPase P [Chloroflexia bacterium]|nr:ATPase P [Chloroflexia bacterium]